jgi:RimJ/RimL family protein N-acetyltransferase
MADVKITTDQFILTKITRNDLEKYHGLCTNPKVMKFVTGNALTREESDQMLLDFIGLYKEQSAFGRYFVELKTNGHLIGLAKLDDFEGQAEIGYRILEEFWGKGYATSLVKALLDYTATQLKLRANVAFVDIQNGASIRVLEKAGMVNIEQIEEVDIIKYKFIYTHWPQSMVEHWIHRFVTMLL